MRFVARVVPLWMLCSTLLVSGPAFAQDDVPEVVRELLAEGDRHRDAGRVKKATLSYLEARRLGPSVGEVYISLGALYVGEKELEKALEAFDAGLSMMPEDRQLLYNSGVVAMRLERFDTALAAVERALSGHRADSELHSLHSAVLDRLGRPEEALAALEQALRHKPGDPQILFRLGNLHHQLGDKEKAVEAFSTAVKKDRGMLRAYYNLGAVLLELGHYDQALDAYEVALEPLEKAFARGEAVDAVHARAFQNLGAIHFHKQDWARAAAAYSKALELDPEQSSALYNQGFVSFRLGRLDDARELYLKALDLDPELPVAYLHLGQIHRQRGELDDAVHWLSNGMSRFDSSSRLEAQRALASCQDQLGRLKEAEQAYRAVLDAEPGDLPTRLALGRLLRRAGRPAAARGELERVRAAAPENLTAALELAALARAEERTEDEKALYEELLQRAGEQPSLWPVRLNLALLHLRLGDVAEARPHLETLARLKASSKRQANGLPGTEERKLIATMRGLLAALDGDLAGSRKRLRAVLSEDASFAAAADVLAVLDVLDGKSEAAKALAASYGRRRGGALEPAARANLGQALWLTGQTDAAREHLEAASGAFPRWTSLRATLGHAALAEKRYQEAIGHFSEAEALCRRASASGSALAGGVGLEDYFSTTVGGTEDAGGELCGGIAGPLALARLGAAFEALGPALRGSDTLTTVAQLADSALAGPLDPSARAVASFVRGTARLAQGRDQAARGDLSQATAGSLPASLGAKAFNNLGVAETRLGRIAAARAAFAAARSGAGASAEATLNLGILLDDYTGESRQALDHYRDYLAGQGRRSREVEGWIERLERIYR